jgi:hypothetical protein
MHLHDPFDRGLAQHEVASYRTLFRSPLPPSLVSPLAQHPSRPGADGDPYRDRIARACADIKAENFLYKTRESEIDDFQLIDFGISKVRRMSGLHTRSFIERSSRRRVAAP